MSDLAVTSPTNVKTLVSRIQSRLDELGLSDRAASIKMSGKPDTIRNLRRAADKGEPYSPRSDTLQKMASGLETTVEWLLSGSDTSESAPLRSGYRPPPRFISDSSFRLPVHSSAEGGDGALILSSGPIEYQTPPAFLEGVEEGYGILFTGESMVPAVKPGQIGWVDPRMPPMSGEEHVFYSARPDLGEERAMVKDLVRFTKTKWHVHQWNPERAFDLDRREWQRCHRIMAKFNRR